MGEKTKSLLFKMLFLIIVLIVIPIAVAGIYLYSHISNDLTEMEKERVEISNQAAESLLNKLGNNLLGVNKTNSHWEDNRLAVKNKDVLWLEENVNIGVGVIPNVNFIASTDLQGNIISQVGDVEEFSGSTIEANIVDELENKEEFSGIMQTSDGLAVIAVSKVTNEEGDAEPTGILIFGRILDNAALADIKDTLKDDIALLTSTETFLSTSEEISESTLKKYISNIEEGLKIFEISNVNSMENAQMITTLKDFTNTPIGILYVNQEQKATTLVKNSLNSVNIIIGCIFIIILTVLSVLIYWLIIKPTKELVKISEKISKGELTVEVDERITKRQDEFGRLGNSMNVMIFNTRNLIQEVATSIDQVASFSEELSASTEETTNATNRIVLEISEIAKGSEIQLRGALESSKAIEEMSKGILSITETISDVSSNSEKTEVEVERGSKSVQVAIQQMEKINESFEASTHKVNQLSDRSKEIGNMAALITNIADQTNLLALNAAIEAARAGEHGKGFAVVADEVRKLAEQTATSAKQVTEMVKIIQYETISSVQSMAMVNTEVHEGLKQIQEVGNVFSKILLAAQNVVQQTSEVSMVSEEMAVSSQQVAYSVEQMATVAEKSTDFSQNVSITSEEQLASMKEIANATDDLAKMAQELKSLINKFVI